MTVTELIAGHEGYSRTVYLCTAKKRTIGYGYNLDANPLKLSPAEINNLVKLGTTKEAAHNLLTDSIEQLTKQLSAKLPWWSKLNAARQAVLLDMAFNLGVDGLMKFKKTLSLIERGDYASASKEMLNSVWAAQVKRRAADLSLIMQTGKIN